jgi:hypothetical protein
MFSSMSHVTTAVFQANFDCIEQGVIYALCDIDEEDDSTSLDTFNRASWLGRHTVSEAVRCSFYRFTQWELSIRKDIGLMWRFAKLGVVIHPNKGKVVILTPIKVIKEKTQTRSDYPVSGKPVSSSWLDHQYGPSVTKEARQEIARLPINRR